METLNIEIAVSPGAEKENESSLASSVADTSRGLHVLGAKQVPFVTDSDQSTSEGRETTTTSTTSGNTCTSALACAAPIAAVSPNGESADTKTKHWTEQYDSSSDEEADEYVGGYMTFSEYQEMQIRDSERRLELRGHYIQQLVAEEKTQSHSSDSGVVIEGNPKAPNVTSAKEEARSLSLCGPNGGQSGGVLDNPEKDDNVPIFLEESNDEKTHDTSNSAEADKPTKARTESDAIHNLEKGNNGLQRCLGRPRRRMVQNRRSPRTRQIPREDNRKDETLKRRRSHGSPVRRSPRKMSAERESSNLDTLKVQNKKIVTARRTPAAPLRRDSSNAGARRKAGKAVSSRRSPPNPSKLDSLIGSRVYACYPENRRWYWAVVTCIKQDKCSLLFDDGDEIGIALRDIEKSLITESECSEYGLSPAPLLPSSVEHADKLKKGLSRAYQSSLSLYPTTGSRVYSIHEDQWGIIEKKHQQHNGTFRYSVRLESGRALPRRLGDADILPEIGYRQKTGKDPPHAPDVMDYGSDKDSESSYGGGSGTAIRTTMDNFLVGRKARFVWLDINGRRKEVLGHVEACEVGSETADVIKCLVVYQENLRSLANSMKSMDNSLVPEYQWLDPELVYGACNCYEERGAQPIADRWSDLPPRMEWVVPNVWSVENFEGLPRLKLVYGDFLLEFSVRDSTIKNAGKGVFVACTPIETNEQQNFQLVGGKCLDIGIYAPLCPADKKFDAICIVKNYLHFNKCETWLFEANDLNSRYDITEDATGELHSLAKRSILPFVNENDDPERICIHAVHDPENSLHYLIGNLQDPNRTFTLPCDGTPREVFVNYGQGYEKVRIRNKYHFLPKSERKHLEKELENECVTDVQAFGAFYSAEVEDVTTFLFDLFVKEGDRSKFTDEMVDRAITIAVVLLQRSKNLVSEDNEDESADLFNRLSSLVNELFKLAKSDTSKLKRLQHDGNVRGLCMAVFKRQDFDAGELKELERSMKELEKSTS